MFHGLWSPAAAPGIRGCRGIPSTWAKNNSASWSAGTRALPAARGRGRCSSSAATAQRLHRSISAPASTRIVLQPCPSGWNRRDQAPIRRWVHFSPSSSDSVIREALFDLTERLPANSRALWPSWEGDGTWCGATASIATGTSPCSVQSCRGRTRTKTRTRARARASPLFRALLHSQTRSLNPEAGAPVSWRGRWREMGDTSSRWV